MWRPPFFFWTDVRAAFKSALILLFSYTLQAGKLWALWHTKF